MRFQFADRQGGGAAGPSADEQLAALDEDKNGYLEKPEVEKKSPGTVAMFDDWDANGDGMVYAKEIASYDRGRRAPQATAIRIAASDDQDALFPCLDADFDGRLTARELREAPERLARLDADGDGQLAVEEIPGGMTVLIERGASMSDAPQAYRAAPVEAGAAEGPKWFVFMDSNRDAEVSSREFPGSREKFALLDADGDGFITVSEAEAASEEKGNENDHQ
jgi:Ca2+-binding EF-hand superfamily protein